MSQTTYLVDRLVAVAGMIAVGDERHCATWPASEVIPFGRGVEVVSGQVRLYQSTGQDGASGLAGVAIYKDMHYAGGYQIGEMVPVLRVGQVWVDFVGTGATELEDAKVSHSSTVTTDRGKFTDAASSATATTEVSSVVGKFRGAKATATLALVELNLPGAGAGG